jgi:AraC family transcriptional regulator of adaptative response / DNA-3-methyladenine glycosylase II
VTPDGLARSARAHFARRLLDDTDLTITEIAFATGFGSLRQFNRACREIFRAPPRTLRAKRRKADRLVADGGLLLRLPFVGALDWDAIIDHLAARAISGVEHVSTGIYRRTITIGGDPGVLELSAGGPDHLLLRAHLPHWEELTHVVSRARRIASLDVDSDAPVRQLAADQFIGPLVRARRGLRPPGTWDPFETGVRAIIGEGISAGAANALAARLVQSTGKPVRGLVPMGLTHTFPSPETVAAADLIGLGLSRAQAAALAAFARAVVGGTICLDRSIGLDHLVATMRLAGIGAATAHYLALRLGEPDACPIADLGVRRALIEYAGRSNATLTDAADRWRPWRALAVTHLWAATARSLATHEQIGAA